MRLLVCVLVLAACGRHEEKKVVANEAKNEPASSDASVLEGVEVITATEASGRVAKAFPKGLPVDPSSGVGVPPASAFDYLGEGVDWVAKLRFEPPISVEKVRAAAPDQAVLFERNGEWHFLDDDTKGTTSQVAVTADIIGEGVRSVAEIDADIARAKERLAKIDPRAPSVPHSRDELIAKATKAVAFAKKYERFDGPQLDSGIHILAPEGTKFSSRAIWEAVYAAGFHWGDGDYFYLSGSDDGMDGIGMSGTTATGYFFPEWVTNNDPQGEADALEMSIDVPRTYKPDVAFDVMVRAARYIAKRLGGTVVDRDDKPYDEQAERAKLLEMIEGLRAAGMEPGTSLAFRVF